MLLVVVDVQFRSVPSFFQLVTISYRIQLCNDWGNLMTYSEIRQERLGPAQVVAGPVAGLHQWQLDPDQPTAVLG